MKIVGSIVLFLMVTNLLAQNTISDTVKINQVTVQGAAQKSNQERLDSTILSDPQHLNLGDLLSKKSHLFIKSYGIGSLATISLRGSGSAHTLLNWNGISLNSSMNGTSDLALFPLFFMDEVSLNYGLSSSIDGTGGIGGSVNISTLPQFKKQLNLFVSSNFGSFGQQQLNAKVKIGNEKFQSITKLIHNKADNNFEYIDLTVEGFPKRQVKNANLLQKGVMQSFFFKLKRNQLVEANFWWFDSERNLPPLIALRENTEFQEDISIKSLVKYSKYFDSSVLKLTGAYIDDELKYVNQRAGIASKAQMKSLRTRADYEFNFKKIELHSQLKFDNNKVTADGLAKEVEQSRLEVYLRARHSITEQFNVNLSVRNFQVLQSESYLLPQLRFDYQIGKSNVKLFALAGKNVKYPNLNDLYYQPSGNISLNAEESESVEFGSTYQMDLIKEKFYVNSSTTLFYNNIENYIQWVPTAFGFWRPNNLKAVETMGAEFFVEVKQPKGKLKKHLSATYSYTSSKNYKKQHEFDESRGKQLIYIPEHKGNISLNLEFMGSAFTINYQMLGIRFISSDNEDLLPSYSLLDVGLSQYVSINRKYLIKVTAGVKNVLNDEYQAIEWRPMPNRNYFVQLAYQFKK